MDTLIAIQLCDEFLSELENSNERDRVFKVPKLYHVPELQGWKYGVSRLVFYGPDSNLENLVRAICNEIKIELRQRGLKPSFAMIELPAGPPGDSAFSISQVKRGIGSVRLIGTEFFVSEEVSLPNGWVQIAERRYDINKDELRYNVAVCSALRVDVPTERIPYEIELKPERTAGC